MRCACRGETFFARNVYLCFYFSGIFPAVVFGRMIILPYKFDYTMNVVRHNDILMQNNIFEMLWNFEPTAFSNPSNTI